MSHNDAQGPSRRRFLKGTVGAILAGSLMSRFAGNAEAAVGFKRTVGAERPVPEGEAMPYKIGVAMEDVTPTWPVPLAGFSFRKGKPSEGVYQPLYVRAMSIDDGGKKLVYVMGDICYWDRKGGRGPRPGADNSRGTGAGLGIIKSIQDQLRRSHGLEPDQIVFVATHTHSGPVLNDERFKAKLIPATVKCVQDAIAGEKEGRLFFGRGSTDVGASRRAQLLNGEDAWQISPYSSHDHEVVVVKAVDRSGKVIGLMFNYGCHPTTMGTQLIGGDYCGFAQLELQKRLGGAVAMFLQGCGGDGKTDNPQPGKRFLFLTPTKATVDQPEKLGKRLADDVCKVLKGKMEEIDGRIQYGSTVVNLPVLSAWTGEKWVDTRAGFSPSDPLSGPRRRMARMARWITESMDANGEYKVTQAADLYVTRIGDKFIHVGLSGEACSPYSLRIKDQLRGNNVMVTGYTGPMHGYVPGMAQIPYGGYEVFTNGNRKPYSPEVEDMIVCDAMELVETVGNKIPPLEPPKVEES